MRKRSFYPKLAVMNIKNNGKFYFPYLATCVFTIAMFYINVFIKTNEGIMTMPGADTLESFLGFGIVIIGIFAAIFLFYTNSFLMKRRKKEIGLYNILGMGKRHIAKMLFYETVVTGIAVIVIGLGVGILLSKLVLLLLIKLLRFSVPFGFTVSGAGISASLILFAVIFVLILLFNLLQIRLSKPIELLKGGDVGQREPKTKVILTAFGIIALAAAYWIAITTKSPIQAVFLFFISVVLVIVGTYALFTTGSITALKLMRRNKKFYYQTKHFTAVSGMIYRMKQNAVGLANICILSTMVLVTLSTTVALYVGIEDILSARYANDISVTLMSPDEGMREQTVKKVKQLVSAHGLKPTNWLDYTALSLSAKHESGVFTADSANYSGVQSACWLMLVTAPDYERMTGEETALAPGEVLIYSLGPEPGDNIELFKMPFTVKRHLTGFPAANKNEARIYAIYCIVVPDETTLRVIYDKQTEAYGTNRSEITGYIKMDIDGEDEKIIDCAKAIESALTATSIITDKNGNARTVTEHLAYVECKQAASADTYAVYGSFLFLGIFLGSLFLMATILIIYYKQITEGYSDKNRFAIMQNVGMSRQEVRQSIRSQVLTVFFLPLAAACLHIAFAFSIIVRILALFELTNVPLFFRCTVDTIAVFGIFYALIYAVTARVYYKIVS
ncbi:MAG: ABC transporter permease [Clostridiales bacterium]|nr:ABC transporter permease [Clostridiales bacterium]